MDILHLVDRIEEAVRKSPRLPFSATRLVDERKIWTLLEQMRISVPEDVRRAQRISRERDQILAEARERAEGLVRQAEGRAVELTQEHVVSRAAEARASTIRDKAEHEAASLRSDANDYVFNALCRLEEELRRTLHVVENGLRKIQSEQVAVDEDATEA